MPSLLRLEGITSIVINRIAGNRGQSHEPALDETNRHDRIDRHGKPITGEQTGEYREGEYI